MRIRRCPLWLFAALCLAVIGPGGQTLFAQNSIPQTILNAQAELTAQEKAAIDSFVDAQVQRLKSEDLAEIATGRAQLVDQFGVSNSPFFQTYYRQSIAQRVAPLMDPQGPLMTRLNVAIISAKLTGDGLVQLLRAGAGDDSPAVRYWIAKAVGEAAKNESFDQPQQQAVLNVLAQRLKDEDAALVLEQVMVAISAIQLPQATGLVLAGLDSRVGFHVNDPKAHYKPIQGGMQQLYRKLVEQSSGGANVNNELHELARIAYRYFTLAGDQLDQLNAIVGPNDDVEAIQQDKAQMAGLCQQVLTYVVRDVTRLSAPQPVAPGNGAQIKAAAALWQALLQGAPFNFTEAQLAIPPRQQDTEEQDAQQQDGEQPEGEQPEGEPTAQP